MVTTRKQTYARNYTEDDRNRTSASAPARNTRSRKAQQAGPVLKRKTIEGHPDRRNLKGKQRGKLEGEGWSKTIPVHTGFQHHDLVGRVKKLSQQVNYVQTQPDETQGPQATLASPFSARQLGLGSNPYRSSPLPNNSFFDPTAAQQPMTLPSWAQPTINDTNMLFANPAQSYQGNQVGLDSDQDIEMGGQFFEEAFPDYAYDGQHTDNSTGPARSFETYYGTYGSDVDDDAHFDEMMWS